VSPSEPAACVSCTIPSHAVLAPGAEEGRFAFYASVHKENAKSKKRPDHRDFHQLCLHATYKATANSEQLLGELADNVEELVAQRLGIKKRSSARDSDDAHGEPLLCFQFNSGQGAYVLHGDDPGDPYPQDDNFIAGGGGFGSTIANVTLRKGATIVFEIYNPQADLDASTASNIAAVSFKVEPGSIWAMKFGALYLGETNDSTSKKLVVLHVYNVAMFGCAQQYILGVCAVVCVGAHGVLPDCRLSIQTC
jgi:hypothetical protein